ncbi:hypothetical protein VTP01DRAFT_1126 [Rhizomucor pusillus]|uniref:uncharacterized protein n=1 Tax=Rhizomucor pusillus TaxID=4840 RepID=UPI003742BC98
MHRRCRLDDLPVELLTQIFVYAQNPNLAVVSKSFWGLSQSSLVRSQYLFHRYGKIASLGERAMSSKIANIDVVDNLLRMGCNPRADGDWLYWKACENQDEELCAKLLDAMQPSKRTLGHFLNVAAMKGSTNIIDLIVNSYNADIHQPNGEDRVLMLACAENQVDVVRHLMEKYGCDIHRNRERHLRRACLHGHVELVELLLPGADVSMFNDAALQNAAHKGHWQIVDRLLEAGANPQANRNAPLKYAISNNNLSSVISLLRAGADPRCQQDWPLRHACRNDAAEIVRILLAHHADPDALNGMPLREALRAGNYDIARQLLEHGADPNSTGALRGLSDAIRDKNAAIIGLMLQHGAKLDHPTLLSLQSSTASNFDSNNLFIEW